MTSIGLLRLFVAVISLFIPLGRVGSCAPVQQHAVAKTSPNLEYKSAVQSRLATVLVPICLYPMWAGSLDYLSSAYHHPQDIRWIPLFCSLCDCSTGTLRCPAINACTFWITTHWCTFKMSCSCYQLKSMEVKENNGTLSSNLKVDTALLRWTTQLVPIIRSTPLERVYRMMAVVKGAIMISAPRMAC